MVEPPNSSLKKKRCPTKGLLTRGQVVKATQQEWREHKHKQGSKRRRIGANWLAKAKISPGHQ